MVAGGVGLAPFVTLAESLRARGVRSTLFYGARRGEELFCLNLFQDLEVELTLTTEDGSAGEHGRVTAPLERRPRVPRPGRAGDDLRVRPGRHAGRHGEDRDALRTPVPGVGGARHGMRAGRLLQLRRADAHRSRGLPSRAIVPQRAGARGRSDTLGMKTFHHGGHGGHRGRDLLSFRGLVPSVVDSSLVSCPPCPLWWRALMTWISPFKSVPSP